MLDLSWSFSISGYNELGIDCRIELLISPSIKATFSGESRMLRCYNPRTFGRPTLGPKSRDSTRTPEGKVDFILRTLRFSTKLVVID